MPIRTLAAALALALAAACARRFDPRLVDSPVAGRTWVSTDDREHPLVGKIWDPRADRFVDEAALAAALQAADFVVLGETHDNPDHHLLQARFLRAIMASGRRPALAFEMLSLDKQPAVDASLARAPKDPDALAEAVAWKTSGWPDFELYRPIFAAGLEAGLPIVAAFPPREHVKQIVAKGRDALDDDVRERLAREEPIPDAMLDELREEMGASHCGALPASIVDALVLAQRARDARMAQRIVAAGEGRGAVLITGSGHARTDMGVPPLVAKDAPGKSVVSVAFVEVDPAVREAAGQHHGEKRSLAFDFVVFTPGAEREDPCAGMRAHVQRKRASDAKEKPAPGEKKNAAPDAATPAPGAAQPAAP
jgi:uncharacterized iron-regulated protein